MLPDKHFLISILIVLGLSIHYIPVDFNDLLYRVWLAFFGGVVLDIDHLIVGFCSSPKGFLMALFTLNLEIVSRFVIENNTIWNYFFWHFFLLGMVFGIVSRFLKEVHLITLRIVVVGHFFLDYLFADTRLATYLMMLCGIVVGYVVSRISLAIDEHIRGAISSYVKRFIKAF